VTQPPRAVAAAASAARGTGTGTAHPATGIGTSYSETLCSYCRTGHDRPPQRPCCQDPGWGGARLSPDRPHATPTAPYWVNSRARASALVCAGRIGLRRLLAISWRDGSGGVGCRPDLPAAACPLDYQDAGMVSLDDGQLSEYVLDRYARGENRDRLWLGRRRYRRPGQPGAAPRGCCSRGRPTAARPGTGRPSPRRHPGCR
jgi:hypothetical protein